MKRNNVKLISADDLKTMKEKYKFELDSSGNNILVKTNTNSRLTYHNSCKPFGINMVGKRVVVFSMDAISIWKELYSVYNYSLLEVQNAVNKLYITFQEITTENVQKILSEEDIKIKEN